MTKIYTNMVALLLLFLSGFVGMQNLSQPTQSNMKPVSIINFEQELEHIRQLSKIPGMSAVVVKDQQVVWAQGFGYANMDKQVPATPETPYELASVTKPFAAILLMSLVESGKLDLRDPIGKYGLQFGDPSQIQIKHVLSHTSQGVPGAEFQYNGDRFAELDLVFKPVSDHSFSQLLTERILTPVAMDNTAPSPISRGDGLGSFAIWFENQSIYRHRAKPYRLDENYQVQTGQCPEFFMPSAGLISSVSDLAKFDIALDQNQFLQPETQAFMFEPLRSNQGEKLPYGMGWFSQVFEGRRLIWHYGWQPNCGSTLYIKLPDDNLSFIVLANSDNLSRPYRFGTGEVLPFDSPVGLAFYKTFVLTNKSNGSIPGIAWQGSLNAIEAQLRKIEQPEALAFLERELLAYRKLFAGVGDIEQANTLEQVHRQVFQQPNFETSTLLELGPPPWSFMRMPVMLHLTILILILIAILPAMVWWPIALLIDQFKKGRAGYLPLSKKTRQTRILAFSNGLLILLILFLYITFMGRFPRDGLLTWLDGSWLVKSLLGAVLLNAALSLTLLVILVRGWIEQVEPLRRRIAHSVITCAGALCMLVWYQLGFLDWIS